LEDGAEIIVMENPDNILRNLRCAFIAFLSLPLSSLSRWLCQEEPRKR